MDPGSHLGGESFRGRDEINDDDEVNEVEMMSPIRRPVSDYLRLIKR